jgi:hypothetical protein
MSRWPGLLDKIDKVPGCWLWPGPFTRHGYGRYNDGYAHRALYEHLVDTIPEEMEVDHLCSNRWCVNPQHMEIVTPGTNKARAGIMREWKNRIKRWYETGEWLSTNTAAMRKRQVK